MDPDNPSIPPPTCRWCGEPAVESIVVHHGDIKKIRALGGPPAVIGLPRYAQACARHARVQRTPDPRQRRVAEERAATAWKARWLSFGDGRS